MTTLLLRMNTEVAKRTAEPHALKYVEPAFNGNVEAAEHLSVALGDQNRGDIAVIMWVAKADRAAYRAFLNDAWMHSHGHIAAAAGTRRRLAAMFKYAQFDIPAELGDTVRVWRGASGIDLQTARVGHSWTTDRDTACWFAIRPFSTHGTNWNPTGTEPLVIVADVPRSDIAYFTNERNESEAIILKMPDARIDGNMADWTAGFNRLQSSRAERQKQAA